MLAAPYFLASALLANLASAVFDESRMTFEGLPTSTSSFWRAGQEVNFRFRWNRSPKTSTEFVISLDAWNHWKREMGNPRYQDADQAGWINCTAVVPGDIPTDRYKLKFESRFWGYDYAESPEMVNILSTTDPAGLTTTLIAPMNVTTTNQTLHHEVIPVPCGLISGNCIGYSKTGARIIATSELSVHMLSTQEYDVSTSAPVSSATMTPCTSSTVPAPTSPCSSIVPFTGVVSPTTTVSSLIGYTSTFTTIILETIGAELPPVMQLFPVDKDAPSAADAFIPTAPPPVAPVAAQVTTYGAEISLPKAAVSREPQMCKARA